jgi:hypothetical protein
MRRDVFIVNDSGGLSVIAADAADAIIKDARKNDLRFVKDQKALLLELYGDDSMPVRIVVNEPLRDDEEAEWLARATWRLDTSDGRLLVMGGFDPDLLALWRDESGRGANVRGVALFDVGPGSWRVDVYAHAGSMNGRQILSEADVKPGAAFRRSHPGRPFPLWLAKMLEFSADADPGHEDDWQDLQASVESGRLAVDTNDVSTIGFVVHVMPWTGPVPEPPETGWFPRDVNRRLPATFPLGLTSDVIDPELAALRDRLLGRSELEPARAPANTLVQIIDAWDGDPLSPVSAPPVRVRPADAFYLYWMAALTANSPPCFEFQIASDVPWKRPDPTADFAVVSSAGSIIAIGPAPDSGGWQMWWTARAISAPLAEVPDGSTIDLAMAQRPDELEDTEDSNPAIGRARYRGDVSGRTWNIREASPSVAGDTLIEALEFIRDLVDGRRIRLRNPIEREAFVAAALVYAPEEDLLHWDGDVVRVTDEDIRTLLMLAGPVFRTRHGNQWPSDEVD